MEDKINKPTMLLVDGHSLAFRSFYAFSKGGEGGLATKDGVPTSVTYGFLKALLDNCKRIHPESISIAFDTPEPTFRHKTDKNYKANRDVAPEIFFEDLKKLQEILKEDLQLPLYMSPGFEADDVLGTIASLASAEGWSVRILSGDRDLFQLVDDTKDIGVIYMGGGPYSRNKGPLLIDEQGVKSKLGVLPDKVVDLKALTGDSSDNIPGIKGVGPKTAINLLNENNDLDGIYSTLKRLENEGEKAFKGAIKGSIKSKLRKDIDNAYLSRKLAKIIIEVPLEKKLRLKLVGINKNSLIKSLEDLELTSLVKSIDEFVEIFSEGGYKSNKDVSRKENYKVNIKRISKQEDLNKIPNLHPNIIKTTEDFKILLEAINTFTDKDNPIAFDTETTNLNPFKAELVGMGFCWGDNSDQIAYIPIGHVFEEKDNDQDEKQLSLEFILRELEPWFLDPAKYKTLQNTKYDRLILMRHGIEIKGVITDTLLADYVYNSNLKHSLDSIAEREFGFIPTNFDELVKKGENFSNVSIKEASLYCGMDVYLTRKLAILLREKLTKLDSRLIYLLDKIEQPLEAVLAQMESTGIRIDIPYLKNLSSQISTTLKGLESKAHKIASMEFNLSSPKQLGEILFENLGLDKKKSRRTKTGWSTDAVVLEKLESEHPLISIIIEHRILSKLLSTYVDALPQLVERETGRVHTDFNQAVTTTGRLSSSHPNLQNIPIKTQFSKRIRKAFLPQEDWSLISADYSQIELRILSHLSNEEILLEAFRKGEDVHELTAKLLLDKNSISQEERRLGKTINFGVIYGMGPQRFARSTGVTQLEAKEFLLKFKTRYKKVFLYLELQERLALSKGYVETLFGRRRYFNFNPNGLGRLKGKELFEIDLDKARRGGLEAQQLRAAANAPIQGSSADIIKIAMVKLSEKIKSYDLKAKLLLQVHDELVLEAQRDTIQEIKSLVVETMENAVKLNVPLLVDISEGENWMQAK